MSDKEQKQWQASTLKESKLTTFFLTILVILALGFVLHLLQSIFTIDIGWFLQLFIVLNISPFKKEICQKQRKYKPYYMNPE